MIEVVMLIELIGMQLVSARLSRLFIYSWAFSVSSTHHNAAAGSI